MPREREGTQWYKCHIRFPTSAGAADLHFHLRAASYDDAIIQADHRINDLIPDITRNNFTTWAFPDPDYVPSKAHEWWREEDK